MADEQTNRRAFEFQALYCDANGAPITAAICRGIGAALDRATATGRRILDWRGAPIPDALPLRIAGGLHALHLSGTAPALAPIYAGVAGIDPVAILGAAIRDHDAALLRWLDGPPQTNEAGRSASFVAAMLWLAARGCPPAFECREIGSSAGVNLMIDRYAYDLGGVRTGPGESGMTIAPDWRGRPPPDGLGPSFAALRGCDVAPIDLADPDQLRRLKAYVWPDQPERVARLDFAARCAAIEPPDLVAMDAADFVERELARPQPEATTRVLMHSIVWQYLGADEQARITAAMAAAGDRATETRPLAWIRLEADRTMNRHDLTVRHWPGGGAERLLAHAHAHGAWVEWLG